MSLGFARVDDVEGIESLRWEDQQKIRKYVESGAGNNTSTSKSTSTSSTANNAKLEYGIEVSQTSRAGCRKCSEKILKGEVRCCSTSSVMVVAFLYELVRHALGYCYAFFSRYVYSLSLKAQVTRV